MTRAKMREIYLTHFSCNQVNEGLKYLNTLLYFVYGIGNDYSLYNAKPLCRTVECLGELWTH